jgi:hypothetical protein
MIAAKGEAVNTENGQMIAAKGMAIGNANGGIKTAKGVAVNKETGADQADIEMIMKFLGDE